MYIYLYIYKWKIKFMFQTTKELSNGSAHLRQAYAPIPGLRWVGLQFPWFHHLATMWCSRATLKKSERVDYTFTRISVYSVYIYVYIYIYICVCVCVSILIFRHVSDIPKLHPISRIPKILSVPCPFVDLWVSRLLIAQGQTWQGQ